MGGATLVGVIDSAGLLAAYDSQLRTDAETPGALSVTRLGPLRLVTFASGRGFITYQDLGGADAEAIRRMVPRGARALPGRTVDPAGWSGRRGSWPAPGLHEALLAHGFTPTIPSRSWSATRQSLGGGRSAAFRGDAAAGHRGGRHPGDDRDAGRGLRQRPRRRRMLQSTLRRLARGDELELWVAEADGVSSAPGGSTRCRGPTSPGSGAARPGRSGAAAVFTGR